MSALRIVLGVDDIKRDYDLLRTLYKAASHEWRLLTALCFAFGVLSFAISCVMLIKDGLKVSGFFSGRWHTRLFSATSCNFT